MECYRISVLKETTSFKEEHAGLVTQNAPGILLLALYSAIKHASFENDAITGIQKWK